MSAKNPLRSKKTITIKLNGRKVGIALLKSWGDLSRIEPDKRAKIHGALARKAMSMPRVKRALLKKGLAGTLFDGKTYDIWTGQRKFRLERLCSQAEKKQRTQTFTAPAPAAFQQLLHGVTGWLIEPASPSASP